MLYAPLIVAGLVVLVTLGLAIYIYIRDQQRGQTPNLLIIVGPVVLQLIVLVVIFLLLYYGQEAGLVIAWLIVFVVFLIPLFIALLLVTGFKLKK